MSSQYWTPLLVAVQAARWFHEIGVRSVVDIGSGAGKFCVVAHLAGGLRCTGIERRHRLVDAARELALLFEAEDEVQFLHGELGETALPEADAYYMYNPFGENLFGPDERLDDDVELGHERYLRDLRAAELLLQRAPAGTHLLTYNGFGGEVPSSYRSVRVDRASGNALHLWRKVEPTCVQP